MRRTRRTRESLTRSLDPDTPAWIDRHVDARKSLIGMLNPDPIVRIYRAFARRQPLIGTMPRTYYTKKTSNPRHYVMSFQTS
jgi:hypothetical protein